MSYNGTDLSPDPLFLQTGSYDARSDRKTTGDEISAGVVGGGDYAVTYSGGTLVMNVAAGAAYIKGGNIADQGAYRQYISAGTTVTLPIADASNPRIDTIILRSFDNAADASGLNKGRVEVVPGTPTVGATLSNLSGKNSLASLTDLSLSFIVLAYVLVPATATTLTSTAVNVRDQRNTAGLGGSSAIASSMLVSNNGSSRTESNVNTETDWYGSSGLIIPTILTPGQRVIVEAWGYAGVAPSTTPTHIFKTYFGAVTVINTGAFAIWASTASPNQVPFKVTTTIVCDGNTNQLLAKQYWIETNLIIGDVTGTALTSGGQGTVKPAISYHWLGTNTPAIYAQPTTVRFTHQWGTANAANQFLINGWSVRTA